jgi:hypothetical protein
MRTRRQDHKGCPYWLGFQGLRSAELRLLVGASAEIPGAGLRFSGDTDKGSQPRQTGSWRDLAGGMNAACAVEGTRAKGTKTQTDMAAIGFAPAASPR